MDSTPVNDIKKDKEAADREPMVVTSSESQTDEMHTMPVSTAPEPIAMQTTDSESLGIALGAGEGHSISSAPVIGFSAESVAASQKSDNTIMQLSSTVASTPSPNLPESIVNEDTQSPAMDIDNISEIMTPPLMKGDSIYSPTRSLTPMSEKIEGVSPVELIETPDGSVRIKGELDPVHLLSGLTPRSRSSSQSSKSSRGSPKSRQSPSLKGKKKRPPPPKDFFEVTVLIAFNFFNFCAEFNVAVRTFCVV